MVQKFDMKKTLIILILLFFGFSVNTKAEENRLTSNFTEFWECEECKKIYWEGTHIKNLQKFVSELNEKL